MGLSSLLFRVSVAGTSCRPSKPIRRTLVDLFILYFAADRAMLAGVFTLSKNSAGLGDVIVKRMALLSTWQEKCGIAHYSSFLKMALDPHLDITVLPLPREIMRDQDDWDKAEAHIKEIVPKLREFDIVNVQFEPSLFGNDIKDVERRFGSVVSNSRDLIVTFHSFNSTKLPPLRYLLSSIRQRSIAGIYNHIRTCQRAFTWRRIYKSLSSHARNFNVTAIAHTKEDALRLRRLLRDVKIRDNPLSYMSDEFIAGLDRLVRTSDLPKLLPNVDPSVRFVGVFGFFAAHKGFETAISALKFLPDKYHLLMFSGIHEANLRVGEGTNAYLDSLIKLVEKKKLTKRVHFIGSVSDDDLLLSMKLCDAAIMPYTNTGQSASGPASQAVELDRPSYLTRSLQFLELEKYLPGTFQFFDIGNYIELAQKINKGPEGNDRVVGPLRIVDFPKISRQLTIKDTIANYLAASGVASRLDAKNSIAAE
jgi:glycosyltransferase involved in cell wall biosynthesis